MYVRPSYFNVEGTIKLAEKQGKAQRTKDVTEKNRKKDVCLKCTEPKCNGNCKKVKGVSK